MSALQDIKRRDRVAKACASCRRKKIKCDGLDPCSHCQYLKLDCVYQLNKQRKPRAKTSDNILNRILKLEELMVRIAEKVDVDAKRGPASVLLSTGHRGSTLDDTGDGDINDLEIGSELLKTPSYLPMNGDGESYFQQCKDVMNESIDNVTLTARKFPSHFKGAHLGFSMIFSPQSLSYIKLKLQPEDHHITTPMETLLLYVTAWKRVFSSIFSEPQIHTAEQVKRLKTGVFPDNKGLVDDLVNFSERVHMADFICPAEFVRELFDAYYSNKLLHLEKKRKFTYSELMLMNVTLALGTAVFIDTKDPLFGEVTYPTIAKVPTAHLFALQEEAFLNAIFYYNRISAVSEGLQTIQALLLMVIFLETSWVISDANYALIGLAVRYAQEMGLHRIETSAHLPEAERFLRIKIWAACQQIDIELCYRLGKPPLVNIVDVSVLDLFNEISSTDLEKLLCCREEDFERHPYQHDMHKYLFRLSQIRSLSYVRLFSASVEYESVKRLQESVTSINTSLFEMALEIPDDYRPRFYNEPSFDKILQTMGSRSGYDHLSNVMATMLLTYFSHLMTINRVPWQVVASEGESPPLENSQFRKLSLDSARTILHLVRAIDREKCPFLTLNWLSNAPFSAAINIMSNCLNHSGDSEIFKDLSLIIDVSMNFFGFFAKKADHEFKRLLYMRLEMLDLLVRILLRITIKIIEEGSNMNILGSNPALKDHLEVVERKYPQFYQNHTSNKALAEFMKTICNSSAFVHYNTNSSSKIDKFPGSTTPSSATSNSLPSHGNTPGRTDPALPNILHPSDSIDIGANNKFSPDWQFLGEDFPNFAAEEMLNMPNYFFDNGL